MGGKVTGTGEDFERDRGTCLGEKDGEWTKWTSGLCGRSGLCGQLDHSKLTSLRTRARTSATTVHCVHKVHFVHSQLARNYSINNYLHTSQIFCLTLKERPYTLPLLHGAKRFSAWLCRFEQLGELVWHLLSRCQSSPRNKIPQQVVRNYDSVTF